MAKYKNRYREVEAYQLTAENLEELCRISGGVAIDQHDMIDNRPIPGMRIQTMGGIIEVQEGEYLIQSSSGTWHSFPRAEFEKEYEPSNVSPAEYFESIGGRTARPLFGKPPRLGDNNG